MTIDHTHPEATYSRVIACLEQVHRALDRTADNPGLRDGRRSRTPAGGSPASPASSQL